MEEWLEFKMVIFLYRNMFLKFNKEENYLEKEQSKEFRAI